METPKNGFNFNPFLHKSYWSPLNHMHYAYYLPRFPHKSYWFPFKPQHYAYYLPLKPYVLHWFYKKVMKIAILVAEKCLYIYNCNAKIGRISGPG